MNCKYCQSPMEDYGTCPVCGAENPAPEVTTEEAAPKKSRAGLIVFLCLAAVAVIGSVLLLLGWKCFGWFDQKGTKNPEIVADEEGFGTTDISEKTCYSTTEPLSREALDAPVIRIDELEVTNGVFNIYYWMEYYNFMNSYGAYASYFGLDSTLPLDQQESMMPLDENDENSPMMTWEQYFINSAVEACKAYSAMGLAAAEDGYTLSEEMQSQLDSLPTDLATEAEAQGLSSADELVANLFGQGVTLEDYRTYLTSNFTASGYYNDVLAAQVQPTDAEVEAYFDENADSYLEGGVLKVNNINVRHILIQPEQDLDSDEDGTPDDSSEEAWAAAKKAADELYAQWQQDPTEEAFSTLANEHSTDPGSNTNGGLYEDVAPGQMVAAFNDWCFDESRQIGDSGIVETNYGYHIMYFAGTSETRAWFDTASADLLNERLTALTDEKTAPFTEKAMVNYRNILLHDLVTTNAG